VRCLVVSHFHWDREWYRTFQAYRARLVDAVDTVLELSANDDGFRFVLDGQAVLVEDYLAVRPAQREALTGAIAGGRISVGPWYVQPDTLLPSGESLVRNLLVGRQVGTAMGRCSRVAYVPDSFGHPAQLPQLFAGFGLAPFVYWRGNGNELDRLGERWRWVAPDGSTVDAFVLLGGYYNAAFVPPEISDAAVQLIEGIRQERGDSAGFALLMNGFDHMQPDSHIGAVCDEIARRTGWTVERGLLDDLPRADRDALPEYRGDLRGARIANLLPGAASARLPAKALARRLERLLEGWLEPWAAIAPLFYVEDERTALATAWRALLQSQAHDSLLGCTIDAVAEQVSGRLKEAYELADHTLARVLERLGGLGRARMLPATVEQDVVVFNPSPYEHSDVVRVSLDDYPVLRMPLGKPALSPLTLAAAGGSGFSLDGIPARVVPSVDATRPRWIPGVPPMDVEFVARDLPAMGCRRFRLAPSPAAPDQIDDGRDIECAEAAVHANDDGTLDVRIGEQRWRNLLALEDTGDRGDTYDFEPVPADPGASLFALEITRRRHGTGLDALIVRRHLDAPSALTADRKRRDNEHGKIVVEVEASIVPGVPRVDLRVTVDNRVSDHRLRALFPTGVPTLRFLAATTFDISERTTETPDDTTWVHSAPTTFPQHGWVCAGGLTVVAPDLPEAEVTSDGTIAITLLRAVGWLSRFDLPSRPIPAGPEMPTPGAQLHGCHEARLSLLAGVAAADARAAVLGLRGAIVGAGPLLPAGLPLVEIAPRTVLLSALKPAMRGDGIVLRLLNPTGDAIDAEVRLGFPVRALRPVRLDEEPDDWPVECSGRSLRVRVPAHALRTVMLEPLAPIR
jgi:mannosylglycerate hydrolase